MKKEIVEQFYKYKLEEERLLTNSKQREQKQAEKFNIQLRKLRHEIKDWLMRIGGFDSSKIMIPEDIATLNSLVSEASSAITSSAKVHAGLTEYIASSIEDKEAYGHGYTKIVEDYGQMEAIANDSALKAIKKLIKFDNKVNGKSFLSVLMCKFKKSKQQPSNENQSEKS